MEHLQVRVIGGDQVAHIHVANRDDTGEGRGHPFEGDFLFKKTKIGSKRLGIGLVRALRGGRDSRHRVGRRHLVCITPAIWCSCFWPGPNFFAPAQPASGLRELLIKIRCVDLGEQLVFLNVRANVHQPVFRYPLTRAKIDASCQGLTSAGKLRPLPGVVMVGETTATVGIANCFGISRSRLPLPQLRNEPNDQCDCK